MAKKDITKKTAKKTTKKVVKETQVEVQAFEEAAPADIIDETMVEPENMGSEEIEFMNGDPAVIVPVEDISVTLAPDEKSETLEVNSEEPVVEGIETKDIKNNFRSSFGYVWNGQEMDY